MNNQRSNQHKGERVKQTGNRRLNSRYQLLSWLCVASVILGVLILCTPLHAQFTSGSITGTVFDPSGAALPGAVITATNTATNITQTVSTNSSGDFTMPSLQPGDYRLTATAKGFALSTTKVTLTLDQILAFDFHLTVGSSSQTVQVNASSSALALETESHQVGDLLGAHAIENLPSNGRDLFQTLTAATNVYGYSSTQTSDVTTYGGASNSLTIGGTAYGTSSYLQDGVTNFNMLTKTANLQPDIEAVQEVSLVQNGASARFDEPSVVNVITKSGTNAFHGRAYDYLRNDALDAIGYYNFPKPALRYNQFGANIGGPILSSKLFFFFDYSGLRQSQADTLTANVPTASERTGDFSKDSYIIYDPTTYNPQTGTISPFPGNKIPSSELSTFATRFLQYYPLPTGSAIPNVNYQINSASTVSYDEYIGRVDYNIGQNDMIYGAYETTNPNSITPTFANTPIFNNENPRSATNAYVQETHTFNNNVVNIARFGYNGSNILTTIVGAGAQNYVKEFGIQNLNPTPSQWAPPSVGLPSHSGLGDAYAPQGAKQHLYEFADEADWTLGKHNLVIGGELDKIDFNGNWVIVQNGGYYFTGQYTSNHNITNQTGGADIADLLLGYPTYAAGATGSTVGDFRQWNVLPYIQDNWKVNNKLTLNLGLRYDYYGSPNDALGHSNVYDIATNTNHKGTFHQNYLDFAPRAGFAYSINENTAVHGGYGIYYAPFMYTELQFIEANAPNYILQSYAYNLSTLVPVTNAFVANPTGSAMTPFTTSLVMPTPYSQQWNLSVQRSIGSNWLASLTYIGSKFTHTNLRDAVNQARVPSNPQNPSPIQSRRPYPYIGDVYEVENIGYGNYNGLEAELEKRYSNGLSLLTSYVWSKAMDIITGDNENPENGLNPSGNYGPADYNMTNVFKFSPVYQLPFGSGRQMFNNNNWFDRQVIGGWQVSGILSVMSGTPFTVGANDLSDTGGFHTQFANQVCDPNKVAHRSIQHWFNTSCLVQPGVGQLGNERRNNVKGPRTTNLDASAFKDFPIYADKLLQFRADFFDALNHPLLYIPAYQSQNVASPTYGQITDIGGARAIQLSVKIIY